jgi:outer membrane protein OmpU
LGTTALVAAAGFAGIANAQEVKSGAPSLSISGELEFEAAYFDNEGVANDRSFDFWQASDLTFSPSWTHDNGITVVGRIDLETATNTAGNFKTDEVSITFKSASFGTIVLGDDDGPVDGLRTNGPLTGDGLWDGTANDFASNNPGIKLDGGNSSDNTKVMYSTSGLDLSGFTLGVAYTPSNSSGKAGATTEAANDDAFEIGAQWSGNFSGVTLKVGGGYYTADGAPATNLDPSGYNVGAQVGFGAFTFGGGYNSSDDTGANADYDSWNLGVSYAMGDWTIGGNYGDVDRSGTGTDGSAYGLGASYALAKGLSVNGDLMFYENDTTNNDSTVIMLGTKVKF